MGDWAFAIELAGQGVANGLMYSLVALGFVLIYKATDAINFAQGEFVMIAGTVISALASQAYGFPLWLALFAGLVFMILFNIGLERVVLRPLMLPQSTPPSMATTPAMTHARAKYRSTLMPMADET